MTKIVLAGNAITAEILSTYLRRDARYEVVGLTVDDAFVSKGGVDGFRTVGVSALAEAFSPATHRVIMAMGYDDLNRTREGMFERLKAMGYGVETYIHPDARVYTDHPVGEGSIVLPGAVVEPHARVGCNTMVWSNVTVAHHSSVGDHCWVAAGSVISGQARVEHHSFLGVSSTVVNAVTVGEFNIVGAGAMISRDTKPHTVHLARSAEPFRYSSEDYVKHFGI
ncbi:acetyltransferase [Variovorax sp. KK3]|uniref:acetyltransferase n=1 Tax=Variovorax sp. KK3 TaxID=1855728 RepID=UPI00097C3FA6|nr:acetyltransferase [Variovorax sp. KK3]